MLPRRPTRAYTSLALFQQCLALSAVFARSLCAWVVLQIRRRRLVSHSARPTKQSPKEPGPTQSLCARRSLMSAFPPAIARIAHAPLPCRLLLLYIHRPIARRIAIVVAPPQQALILILVPIVVEIKAKLRPPAPAPSQAIALLQVWTARFDARGQAIPNGSKTGPDVVLCEDVDGGLRGLVGGFERCAEVIEAAPEARVVGAIHCDVVVGDEGDDERGGVQAAAVVVGLGGMRAGARAGEVKVR